MALEARLNRARELLLEAMVDPSRWAAALDAVALACNGRAGQLLSIDSAHDVVEHWISGVPENFTGMIEAYGFANSATNPRFRAGLQAPLLTAIADQDYASADERKRSPIYQEIFDPYDLPFNCQVVIKRDADAFVRTSVTRSKEQGPFDAEGFRAFNALVPHLNAAIRVQASLALTARDAALASIDATGACAFLLGHTGRVIAASQAAEAMMLTSFIVQIASDRLLFSAAQDQAAFQSGLSQLKAAERSRTTLAPAPIPLSHGFAILDLQSLPRERTAIAGAPVFIAIVRRAIGEERANALCRAHRLTKAEAIVALAVADGASIDDVARNRQVSLATVRSQLQVIFAKLGVRRQAELVRLLNQ